MPRGSWPSESSDSSAADWKRVPWWPPDVFAVAATLAQLSDLHTHPSVRGGAGLGNHAREAKLLGKAWANFSFSHRSLTRQLQRQWDTLLASSDRLVSIAPAGALLPEWARAAISLLAISDEACAGVGFGGTSAVAVRAQAESAARSYLTLAMAVDPVECSVQPKARTPSVGCNLRSTSLHLALLPGRYQVQTQHLGFPNPLTGNSLGLVLIPFPYVVGTTDFEGKLVQRHAWGRLRVRSRWAEKVSPVELADFTEALIAQSESAGHRCDLVVFPELAMGHSHFHTLADRLTRRGKPCLFVAGVGEGGGEVARNVVRAGVLGMGDGARFWVQSKHHRWKVEKWQIKNYGLSLDPSASWWEDIDVSSRRVIVTHFHRAASIATLVCEDLARIEPVQPVIRELGPTLVLALLMDGPQRAARWPGQYAGVLAEDPGSSVLSVTSLGLVRRYRQFREEGRGDSHAIVGLWKDRAGQAKELGLPPDHHALHLSLRLRRRTEHTLDGRDDGGSARFLTLEGVAPLRHPQAKAWARSFYAS